MDLRYTQDHHPRFAERVLRPEEQDFVNRASHDHHCIWRFWAAKEAAFKAHGQKSKVVFHPLDWEVDLAAETVSYQGTKYFLRLVADADHVRAICSSAADFLLKEALHCYTEDVSSQTQSQDARQLLRDISTGLIDDKSLILEGIPHSKEADKAVSISHHGRFLHAVYGQV